jgi:hypothetical protein
MGASDGNRGKIKKSGKILNIFFSWKNEVSYKEVSNKERQHTPDKPAEKCCAC